MFWQSIIKCGYILNTRCLRYDINITAIISNFIFSVVQKLNNRNYKLPRSQLMINRIFITFANTIRKNFNNVFKNQ